MIRIAQLLLEGSTWYDRKLQRLDARALAGRASVVELLERRGRIVPREDARMPATLSRDLADVVHVYGAPLTASTARRIAVPYVCTAAPQRGRLPLFRPSPPAALLATPGTDGSAGESVDPAYLRNAPSLRDSDGRHRLGVFDATRPRVRFMIDATRARLERFRDDVDWIVFDAPPPPAELAMLDAWVDPSVSPEDRDGFVAEAMCAGLPVIASATPVNRWRLEEGAAGWLVPPGDPNEFTHAIARALFHPGEASSRVERAVEAAGKFSPERRVARLLEIYGTVTDARDR